MALDDRRSWGQTEGRNSLEPKGMAMKTLSVMKLTGTFLCTLCSTLLWLGNAEAGQVVVRDASEPSMPLPSGMNYCVSMSGRNYCARSSNWRSSAACLLYVFLTCAPIATFPAMAIFIAPIFTGNSSSI